MKKITLITLLFIAFTGFISCEADSDALTGNEAEGGLLNIKTKSIGYVVGNGNDFLYKSNFSVFQGSVKTTKVDVYKSFTNSAGVKSNEILLTTVNLPNTNQIESAEFTFSYSQLIQGLTIAGQPLPASDSALEIGEFWSLRYVSTLSSGQVHSNAIVSKVSVGTRFAGDYKCVEALYYRLGVLTYTTGDWPAVTNIESVNSTTYRVNEYFGAFSGNTFYFNLDSSDVITYPATTPSGDPQLGNGQPFITCATNFADFAPIGNCGSPNTNIAVRNDATGKDQLKMTYGYFTTGSGPRVFYQVMEKIVE